MGPQKAFRARLLKALHAEGKKRGFDHEALRELFNCHSLSTVETPALQKCLLSWGKKMRASPLPRRGYAKSGELEIVAGEDLNLLAEAFQRRGWTPDQQRNFIRRQLGGREHIRTKADFHRVFSGVRAINRRDENASASIENTLQPEA